MLARGPAVELVDPDLLAAQVVRVPGVVLDVKPEIGRGLLAFLRRGGVRERERDKTVRDRHGEGVDGDVCCCFYGPRVKKGKRKMCLRGLKTGDTNRGKLRLLHFTDFSLSSLSTGTLYMRCIYRADNHTQRKSPYPTLLKYT